MGYELSYDAEKKIIRGRVLGELNPSLVKNMAVDLEKLGRKHKCPRLLNDLREAVISKSLLDIYSMPRVVEEAGMQKSFRRAIDVNPPVNDYRFLETVSVNEGQEVRVFSDPEEALRWLVAEND
jgi:hypothetical protein